MDSSSLCETFRSDTRDNATPYFWSDSEVLGYANDAYRMFVRLTGGVADFTSEAAAVDIVSGDPLGVLHPSVLRIMSAQRRSDQRAIKIINHTDVARMTVSDYGQNRPLQLDDTPGAVNYGVIGMQRGIIRWLRVPEVDDTADLYVYRLPLERITDFDQALTDVDEDHHLALLHWMKNLAYRKQDAETLNLVKAEDCKATFEAYCAFVKAEWARYKHKTRAVAYGGL